MINYKEKISKIIGEEIPELTSEEIEELLEIPTDRKMGDFAFPCFRLAKIFRKAPVAIGEELTVKLTPFPIFEKVESVNGYVNMYVNRKEYSKDVTKEVLSQGKDYGKSHIGEGKTVIVEFSSPNIAKPFHIGHIRSTVIGNSIYKIHEALGYETIRINHLGDYGTQFGKMICAYRHWGNKKDVEENPIKTLLEYYTKFHIEVEKDPSLDQEAREIFSKLENGAEEEVQLWKWFREESLKEFNRVYGLLDIEFDSLAGESFYSDKMPRFVKELEDKHLLKESDGAMIVDLEKYNMSPALIKKSDGSTLYITRDIAAAVYRKETYDFYKNIYVVASQQNLHFQQWIKVIELLGYSWANDCVHVPFGLVSLKEGTMSTREGRVVFLEDVLNRAVSQTRKIIEEKGVNTENIEETAKAVGIGAVIFQELSNNRIKDYVFDWDRVLNFEGETGPYVQYTHARASSVLRKAETSDLQKVKDGAGMPVTSDEGYELIKLISRYPEIILEAGEKNEPSIVTRHIVKIAQAFNRFYHNQHILVEDEGERLGRLALVMAAKTTIGNGLGLLGIKAPERM